VSPAFRRWVGIARRWFAPVTLVLGFCIAAVALQRMFARDMITVQIAWPLVVAAIVLGLVGLLLSALAWRALLLGVCKRRVNLLEAIAQLSLVLVGKYVPGKVTGLAARVTANADHCSPRLILSATLIEQFGAIATALLCGGVAWFASESWALSAIASVALATWLLVGPSIILFAARRWIDTAVESPSALRGIRHSIAFQVLQWLSLMALAAVMAKGIVDGADAMQLVRLAGAYALAVVAGQLAVIFPGGIGPREGVFVLLCSGLVGESEAIAIALLMRIATTGIDLLAGVLYVFARLKTSVRR
jgi:glycosyltransferase 2 family protein